MPSERAIKRHIPVIVQKFALVPAFTICVITSFAQGFTIIEKPAEKKIEILYNGRLATAYCYYDSIAKPFLFPLRTLDGITVTRGYPIAPVSGERTDHPHHTGVWMNYESVNGLDFWNNSTSIPVDERHRYGTIRHNRVVEKEAKSDQAKLVVTSDWYRPDGHVLLNERTTWHFSVRGNHLLLDRVSELRATGQEVAFRDIKDGFFAIRVARELEMPSTQADVFVDAHGNKTAVAAMNNEGVTGMYLSSEGLRGDSVWGTKARWVMLQGLKEGKEITVAIFDHPSNIGYPAYWHARGYGLFAVNPLGRKIFSNGKETLNFHLPANATVTFRYRLLVSSARLEIPEIDKIADEFER